MQKFNNFEKIEVYVEISICLYLQQLEREISFRTESGLYFSYYKQLVLAPSISEGTLSTLFYLSFQKIKLNL